MQKTKYCLSQPQGKKEKLRFLYNFFFVFRLRGKFYLDTNDERPFGKNYSGNKIVKNSGLYAKISEQYNVELVERQLKQKDNIHSKKTKTIIDTIAIPLIPVNQDLEIHYGDVHVQKKIFELLPEDDAWNEVTKKT